MIDIEPKLILDGAGADEYSDGDEVEDMVLEILKGEEPGERIDGILGDSPSWPMLYHFSPIRRNLLSWYPFKADASLLEVGSGMGALTGLFCEMVDEVTAIELTARRATITAWRNRNCSNLTAIAGNIDGIELERQFDYVTSIGVLEYAGKYSDSADPFSAFLGKLRSFLKPDGTLILAIENRLGFKYWSGAREDHTGRPFDSLEGYPHDKSVQTFSRKELGELLGRSGFGKMEFYYPLPDFKLPIEIFSDAYLPAPTHNIRPGQFPYIDYSQERDYLFNEQLVIDSIIANDSFPLFANSFLVFATP